MKRLILTVALIVATTATAFAQKYIVVDSEKIFKSIDEYNTALTTLDSLSKQYQVAVDAKFKEVENLYNSYMSQKASLGTQARNAYEQQILAQEKSANDGTIMKKRIELIQPIQKRVFAAIEKYAKENGCDIVVDKASNATILYNSETVDRTNDIIALLKQ